jgi:DNA polymerase-3 subunit delta'
MPWQSIRGHDTIVVRFRRALSQGRLASTFLFVGPPGIGKRTFALKLAQGLLCDRVPEERLDPCGECRSCHQVLALTHPDVHLVAKPPDKAFIPLKLLIGEDETRMREGLCYDLGAKAYSGRRKIAIIDDADYLNKEGANCLLKTLEEPPPRSILILIGTSVQRQLPTIRSRCQIMRFSPLSTADVQVLLMESRNCDDPAAAAQAAALSQGSLERAVLWCDEAVVDFRAQLLQLLSGRQADLTTGPKLMGQFVESAGKDSSSKRARLRLVVSFAVEYYRALLAQMTTGQPPTDPELRNAVTAGATWTAGGEAAAACLDVCLDAYANIDSNANPTTLIEWWLDELSQICRDQSWSRHSFAGPAA